MSAGPAPTPGVEIVVGIPFGVETPGGRREFRQFPVNYKFTNELPPAPGCWPRSEPPEPGSVGTLVSSVGACAVARLANIDKTSATTRLPTRTNRLIRLIARGELFRDSARPIS